MSSISDLSSMPIYTPPARSEGRNEPKHDNDSDDRGPKALSAGAAQGPSSVSSIKLSSTSLAALIEMQH